MEVRKEHHRERTNWAEVYISMAQRPVFIHPPILVVLCIVGQGGEDLENV
jgi:hypothetical protein